MTGRVAREYILINSAYRHGILLTLTLILTLAARLSHADPPPAVEIEANRQQIGEVSDYIRKQGMQGISLLPGEARQVIGWFSSGWHPMRMFDDDDPSDAQSAPIAQQALTDTPNVPDEKLADLAGNIHHKGFLPTHDAAVMGVAFKQNIVAHKLEATAKPFFGQSWHSTGDYWGGEAGLDIARHDDGMPWGKIALGYVGGNDALTDHGRGMDLHGDVDLTEGWKFTSGLRQNSWDGNSNYMMIKWQMGFK